MIHVNLFGVLYCTHAALPLLRAGGGGDIVNISSVAGRVATRGVGVYNLTKWGVNAFSESLRQEMVGTGANVRVTMIEPGSVATELQQQNRPEIYEQIRRRWEGLDPLTAEDIANAIVFALGQPSHVSVNEVLVRPSRQL